MLFLVTAEHSEDNCPVYRQELMPDILSSFQDQMTDEELGVKALFSVANGVEHRFFYLLEADDYGDVVKYLFKSKMRQTFKVTPVNWLKDILPIADGIAQSR